MKTTTPVAPAAAPKNKKNAKSADTDKSVVVSGQKHSTPKDAPENPDVTDGSPRVLFDPNDPIIREFGPLFSIDGDKIKLNPPALGAKFVTEHQFRFDDSDGSFRQYSKVTGVWEPLREPKVKLALAAFIKALADHYQVEKLTMMRTNSLLGAILALAKGYKGMGEPDAAAGPLIHVANGVLDLSTGEAVLRGFSADDWSTSACDIGWNGGAKCDRFLNELLTPALNADDIDLLQRYAGSLLFGLNAAQRFQVLHGGASSGKSTLVTILERIVGVANVAHLRTQHLTGRFESHGFQGKKLLTAKDVPSNFLGNTGAKALKALVGADLIETEQKFGDKFQLRGNLNIIVTSNGRLRLPLEDDEGAWRRRLLVLDFSRKEKAKRISHFEDVLLKEEGEGILAWMVEGAVKHLEELKKDGDFRLTPAQLERIENLLLESRSVVEFITGGVVKKAKADVSVDELLRGYVEFCHEKKWEPVSSREFTLKLTDLMIRTHGIYKRNDVQREGSSVRGFKGIALAS